MYRRTLTLVVIAMLGAMLPLGPASASRNDVVAIAAGTTSATSIAVSQATFDSADTVLIGRDGLFADSLASGALQGSTTPLLLTDTDELLAGVLTEIQRLGATEAIILGGTAAISGDVEDALTAAGLTVSRREGPTRIETAIDVADGLTATTALLVRAFPAADGDETQAFADSIAAGGWAASEGWPVLFTQSDQLTASTQAFLDGGDITDVIVIGGEAAVGTAVTDGLDALDIAWRRVSGSNRFATAVAIAAERGFDSEADADRILLVEGQSDDAWAAGFTAAAHAAANNAPIVLANGEELPPATQTFLGGAAFAVDEAAVDGPVLVCATSDAACAEAVGALGLPADATLTVTSGQIDPGGTVTGTFDDGGTPATVDFTGCGFDDATDLTISSGGAFGIDLPDAQATDCNLTFRIIFGNGTIQTEVRNIDILSPSENTRSGQIITLGADTYTFVTSGGASVTVDYDGADLFQIQGTSASEAAWEATVQVGNMVSFSDDTGPDDLDIHNLTTTGDVTSGTIGNVDAPNTTFAFVELNTDTVLRTVDYSTNADATYRRSSTTVTIGGFGDELNEGDSVAITNEGASNEIITVTNASITGLVSGVDSAGASMRFFIDGLGDDPTTSGGGDTKFEANNAGDVFSGSVADTFAEFQEELDAADTVTYSRTGGVERFVLVNSAPPTVTGTATDATAGTVVGYLVSNGATASTFDVTGTAQFRVNNSIVIQGEWLAALTPGDTVTFTPDNPNTAANEQVASLTNANLTGRPTGVQTGPNTLDIVNAAGGMIVDDLDYTTSLYAGAQARYSVDGTEEDITDFETALGTIDGGSTITASPISGDVGTLYALAV